MTTPNLACPTVQLTFNQSSSTVIDLTFPISGAPADLRTYGARMVFRGGDSQALVLELSTVDSTIVLGNSSPNIRATITALATQSGTPIDGIQVGSWELDLYPEGIFDNQAFTAFRGSWMMVPSLNPSIGTIIPTDISGCVLWLRSDTGFTGSVWTDYSGVGNHATQGNPALEFLVVPDRKNGYPALVTASSMLSLDINAVPNVVNSYMVLPGGLPETCTLWWYGRQWNENYRGALSFMINTGVGPNMVTNVSNHWGAYSGGDTSYDSICYRHRVGRFLAGGNNYRLRTDGNPDETFSVLTAGDPRINAFQGGGFGMYGEHIEMAIWSRILSDAEVLQLEQYALSKYRANFIVCDGNSLTAGTGASSKLAAYPAVMKQLLERRGLRADIINRGMGGQDTPTMTAIAPTTINPRVQSGAFGNKSNILIGWEVRNDIVVAHSTPAEALAHIQAYYVQEVAAGFTVVAFTVLPSLDLLEADRQYVNSAIRANYLSWGCSVLVDVENDPVIGAAGANQNVAYYSTDTVHMNDAGYARVAALVANAVAPLIAP